jgi:hypothetical protein
MRLPQGLSDAALAAAVKAQIPAPKETVDAYLIRVAEAADGLKLAPAEKGRVLFIYQHKAFPNTPLTRPEVIASVTKASALEQAAAQARAASGMRRLSGALQAGGRNPGDVPSSGSVAAGLRTRSGGVSTAGAQLPLALRKDAGAPPIPVSSKPAVAPQGSWGLLRDGSTMISYLQNNIVADPRMLAAARLGVSRLRAQAALYTRDTAVSARGNPVMAFMEQEGDGAMAFSLNSEANVLQGLIVVHDPKAELDIAGQLLSSSWNGLLSMTQDPIQGMMPQIVQARAALRKDPKNAQKSRAYAALMQDAWRQHWQWEIEQASPGGPLAPKFVASVAEGIAKDFTNLWGAGVKCVRTGNGFDCFDMETKVPMPVIDVATSWNVGGLVKGGVRVVGEQVLAKGGAALGRTLTDTVAARTTEAAARAASEEAAHAATDAAQAAARAQTEARVTAAKLTGLDPAVSAEDAEAAAYKAGAAKWMKGRHSAVDGEAFTAEVDRQLKMLATGQNRKGFAVLHPREGVMAVDGSWVTMTGRGDLEYTIDATAAGSAYAYEDLAWLAKITKRPVAYVPFKGTGAPLKFLVEPGDSPADILAKLRGRPLTAGAPAMPAVEPPPAVPLGRDPVSAASDATAARIKIAGPAQRLGDFGASGDRRIVVVYQGQPGKFGAGDIVEYEGKPWRVIKHNPGTQDVLMEPADSAGPERPAAAVRPAAPDAAPKAAPPPATPTASSLLASGKKLREGGIDPRKTHIPEFSPFVQKHLQYARNAILKQNVDLGRMDVLKGFEAEAGERVAGRTVTYEWWHDFNYRLSILMTPESQRTALAGGFEQPFVKQLLSTGKWKTNQGFREVADAQPRKSGFGNSIDAFDAAGAFPRRIVLPVIEGDFPIGQINAMYGSDVNPLGLIDRCVTADGREMCPDHFFRHDHVHADNEGYTASRNELSEADLRKLQENYEAYEKTVPAADKQAFEFGYFIATHELPLTGDIVYDGGTRLAANANIVKGALDPGWYADLVPAWARRGEGDARRFLKMADKQMAKFSAAYYPKK